MAETLLAVLGWLVRTFLPAFLAKRWGKAQARAEQAEAENEAREKQAKVAAGCSGLGPADLADRVRKEF